MDAEGRWEEQDLETDGREPDEVREQGREPVSVSVLQTKDADQPGLTEQVAP